jgi:hypothetical protein
VWRSLLRILLKEPSLLSAYASGYALLLKQDAAWWSSQQAHRLTYLVGFAGAVFLFVLFGGIALMLYAVMQESHWLLWAVPAVPLLGALLAGWHVWKAPRLTQPFPRVRAQVEQDMELFGMKEPQ